MGVQPIDAVKYSLLEETVYYANEKAKIFKRILVWINVFVLVHEIFQFLEGGRIRLHILQVDVARFGTASEIDTGNPVLHAPPYCVVIL